MCYVLFLPDIHLVPLGLHRTQVGHRMVRAQLDDPHRGLPSTSLPTSRPQLLQAIDRQIRHTFHLPPQSLALLPRKRQDDGPPVGTGEKIYDLDRIEIRQLFACIDEA